MAGGETERRDGADREARRRSEADGEAESDVDGESESDVAVLRSGREEARVVLDHQLQVLDDQHTKAVRTVRLTGVVFGLLLGGTRVYYGSQWLAQLVRKYVAKKPDEEDS